MTDARVTQVGVDAVIDTGPDARVTQVGVDAVIDTEPPARLSQLMVEVIWRPHLIPTPPSSDWQGIGYADLLLHTGRRVVVGGTPVVVTDGSGVKLKDYWT